MAGPYIRREVFFDQEMVEDTMRIAELMLIPKREKTGWPQNYKRIVKAALRLLRRVLERADQAALQQALLTPTAQKIARGYTHHSGRKLKLKTPAPSASSADDPDAD